MGRVITDRKTRKQGYYIQADKEAGLLHTDRQESRVITDSLNWQQKERRKAMQAINQHLRVERSGA